MDAGKSRKLYLYLGIAGLLIGGGIILSLRGRKRIVKFSESLVGQTEIAGNAGFTNEAFQALMTQVGWQTGEPWCVYFVKLVWYNMAPDWLKSKIEAKVTGSTWTTWQNLSKDPSFKISAIPQEGDLVIWRYYNNDVPTDDGHAGVVKQLGFGNFTTIEGNTNELGGTEGYIVAEKTRTIDYTVKNGLRLVGFIRFA